MSGFCTGDMDLMVSQVRRSVVSVVQQYSHIRWAFPSLLINSSSGVSLLPNELFFFLWVLSGVFTCAATLRGLTWLPWSCPLTGHSTASILKSKVGPQVLLSLLSFIVNQ